MQLNGLGVNARKNERAKKADLPQTMIMRLSAIVTELNKPGFFQGVDVKTGEAVAVRMMNVAEGVLVNKREDESAEAAEARIKKQYIGEGESHRPRPSEIANPNHKTHCAPGGLMAFTKVVKNDDGTYRAHWAETIESKAGASCEMVMAHVSIGEITDRDDRSKVTGAYVAVDQIFPDAAHYLSAENAMTVIEVAFANNHEGVQRSPFLLARIIDTESGSVVTELPEMRVNAKLVEQKVYDHDNGTETLIRRPGTAAETFAHIMDPENVLRDAMIMRAALVAVQQPTGYADFADSVPDSTKASLNSITDGIRSGAYKYEVIPGERINAGPATKSSLLKSWKGNAKHPLNFYKGEQFLDDGTGEKKKRTVKRYFETYVTTKIGENGYKYFTKAVGAEAFPAVISLYNLATANDSKTPAEEAKKRAEEARAGVVDTSEEEFDPTALTTGVDTAGVDANLAASSAALEMS